MDGGVVEDEDDDDDDDDEDEDEAVLRALFKHGTRLSLFDCWICDE